ncbi:MAG: carbohydrate porin [Methylacidiphilales bacterium]|nr:carbohydrate porin [Candidatus Methylacidiphilales bacterium]
MRSPAPATLFLIITISPLCAQETPAPSPVKAEQTRPESIPGFWDQDYLTGDWSGVRTSLADKGVAFGVNYIGEVLGNPTGGIHQGVIHEGRIELTLDLDFQKLAGLDGASFHANAYDIYGNGLSSQKIGNLLPVSNIEAYNTLRLFDLWYQQELLDGKISLRFGQIAADDEFVISQYGATFMNATFGWPPFTANNLASGGPAYPLAAPGIRLMLNPIPQVCLMAAVFDGDPGDGAANPQKNDSSGTNIDFNQGALSFFEADYKLNQEDGAKGLPGTYKLGGFYATENYSDLGVDENGVSLASPASDGKPLRHSGDWGVYFIADQMVWRKPADPKGVKNTSASQPSDQGLGLFWRIGGTPSDRNPIDFYTDGGFNYTGLFPGRDEDVLGFGTAYAHVSDSLSTLDRETNAVTGVNGPVEDEEIALELTYQAKLAPWWTLQPDVQYIIHPGGHVADPTDLSGTRAIPDALVLGVRTTITF